MAMEIRPVTPKDLSSLIEIDATIDSTHYLHVERTGEGMTTQWRLEERPLRQKRVDRNRPSDDLEFLLKNVTSGIEEGMALLAEHDEAKVALLLGHLQPQYKTMQLVDLRIDYDYRRQGLASAMIFQMIADARARELRAVTAECRTDNVPACQLFQKLGFDLAGLDTHRHSNHDLVKESATLFWYSALD